MAHFTELQIEILRSASEWFDVGAEKCMKHDQIGADYCMKQYHKLTDQVQEETGCELWEIINGMGV